MIYINPVVTYSMGTFCINLLFDSQGLLVLRVQKIRGQFPLKG